MDNGFVEADALATMQFPTQQLTSRHFFVLQIPLANENGNPRDFWLLLKLPFLITIIR